MVILHELTVLRRLQTPICVLCDLYGDILASALSRALATAWSHAYCAITIMASTTLADNGSRSRNRGIYIAVSLKTKFKKAPARKMSRLFVGVLV